MKTKSIIAALLLATSSAFAQVPSYVPSNGLVGWWPFNGNAIDESGNGNNGTVNGASLTSDRNGNLNNAYNFNRTINNGIDYSNNNALKFSNNSYSISLWFNSNDVSYLEQDILRNGLYGANNIGYLIYVNNYWNPKKLSFIVSGSGIAPNYYKVDSRDSILANTNYHMVGICDRTNNLLKLYLNGILSDSTIIINLGNQTNNEPVWIGKDYLQNTNSFDGQIDDIGIWNRALTQQEITALYNAQTCNSSSNAITADGPTTFCAGNSVNLTSDVVGGTYQWKKNGVNIATNSTSRTYKATATGSYTCVATCNGTALTSNAIAVTSKTNASATVTASGATSFCLGDSVTLNATNLGSSYSVQWYRTNISMENATAYSQVVKQPGTYKVVTKNLTTGCSRISSSSAIVAVSCRLANPNVITNDLISTDFDAKVAGGDAKGKIYIYPNPTSDNKFTVELMGLEVDGNATLEVYNGMGQILFSEKVNISNGSLNRTIEIDEQSRGQLCLVRLMAGSEVYDSKVILK